MWLWMNREYTGPSLEEETFAVQGKKTYNTYSIVMHAHSTCMYAVSPPTHFHTRDGLLCIMNKFRMANALRL